MYIVNSYTLAIIFCFITMICWGSWGNTQKLASKNWRYELYYWDYTIGILLFALLLVFTLGSFGDSGRGFLDDLGTDQIHVFPVSENVTDGVSHSLLNESEEFNIKVESGSGPRHICFHPNQKFAYLINEISGKVIAFSYDKGKLNTIQYIEADTVGAKGSGDIHISPDGKFLYASNRLKADGIAIFSINQEEGTLTKTGYQLTGIHPRNFIISRNGRYLLVACRDSNSIQVFERDSQTGLLKDTGKTIKTNKPVCLKFTF